MLDTQVTLMERIAFERLLVNLSARLSDIGEADFVVRTERALFDVIAYLGCDRCTFSEFVGGDYLTVLCSAGSSEAAALQRGRFRFPLPWFFDELRSGRIVAMAKLPGDLPPEAVEEAEHCRRIGLRSHLSIPVRIGRRVTGVLSLGVLHVGRGWPSETIDRLKIVGDLLGGSVALARVEEEARQMRQRLWHADRVQRINALTAAIAHEFNQPLTAILSNAQAGLHFLAREDAKPEMIIPILESVVRESKRAAETVRGIRALMRRDDSQREAFDLAVALNQAKRLVKSEFAGNGVRMETNFDSGCWVSAYKVQIEQMALNLMLNAVAAVQDKPTAQRVVSLGIAMSGAKHVRLSVRDTGRGIAPVDLESIFEPFWTMRPGGMGLGLAICRSIVEGHGGRIWAESNAQGGATFSVELPLVPAPLDQSAAAHAEIAHAGVMSREGMNRPAGTEPLVCIVDDEPAVRVGLKRLLEGAGWPTIVYASAEDFLANPPPGDVACILLDMQMPGLSGPELHRRLIDRGCMASFVFITGRGDVLTGVAAMKRGAADVLEKPVDSEVLLAAVRRALNSHAHARRDAVVQEALNQRIARLSPREYEVMLHVLRGRLNKQIAGDLRIVEQTVKQHRSRVMEKMGVRSLAELVRACEAAGVKLDSSPAP
ncbi:ATP-binding protein [Variovorax ginsengisoli]|uniref:histidine kinase n=1 Tax=Variovorax ginsengisoli TaxID=363844 RepID=A0ABT8SGR6_9BURK|nr:ATP-binding protein [Variovorax ginsengisoli]MDN8618909.1 ATP-binding protein [Variovorax ginsengisoli]MDO1538079.1 ATP-binding protein [Variovorax ginsengisoli]